MFCNGQESDDGAALMVLDASVPFAVSKTCSFQPESRALSVTRANLLERVLYELDGRPVLEVYAELVGKRASELDTDVFMTNPLGLHDRRKALDSQPAAGVAGRQLEAVLQAFFEGSDVYLMQSTDLVEDTRKELARVKAALGGSLSGGVAFNCILRRLELDAKALHGPFLEVFHGLETAGFHTYGESYLGHINQTLVGLWFK